MFRDAKTATSFSRPIGNGRTATGQARAKSPFAKYGVPARPAAPSPIASLSAIALFRDLSPEEMKMVDQSTFTTTARKGEIIYRPGETGEVLYLLLKGSAHLYQLSAEGRKLILQTVSPMTCFGEMPLIGHYMHNLFAEAAEDCTICAMSRADLDRLMRWKPQVALRMLEEIGERLLDVQERLSESVFKGVPARLASSLLKASNNGAYLIRGFTHQYLADVLGVYRETVTLALNGLRDQGIIKLGRKEIAILRPEQLRQAAENEMLRSAILGRASQITIGQRTSLRGEGLSGKTTTTQSKQLKCKQRY